MNIMTLFGHLGNDPETKPISKDGNTTSVTTFSIADSFGKGDSKTTVWYRCEAWGRQGETIAKFVKKGQTLLVTGTLQPREFTDKDGKTRVSQDLKVDKFQFTSPAAADTAATPVTSDAGAADADIPF